MQHDKDNEITNVVITRFDVVDEETFNVVDGKIVINEDVYNDTETLTK